VIAQVVNDFGDASYQQSSELPGWASAALFVLAIGFVVVLIASIWTILKAGGQPGWHALVPVLNTYSLANAAQLQGCLIVILTFVPCVNYITYAYLWWSIGKRFGRGTGFNLGLVFLPPIFVPALAVSLRREQRRVAALPPIGSPGSLPRPQVPAGPASTAFLPPAPSAAPAPSYPLPPGPAVAGVGLPPAPTAPPPSSAPALLPPPMVVPVPVPPLPGLVAPAPAPPARVFVDGLEVARLADPTPGTTSEDRQEFAVAAVAPVLDVELADGTRTQFDLTGVAEPGATWTLETWIGPAAAAVEAVVTVPGRGDRPATRLVLQPVLLPGGGVTEDDLSGHGLSSRGLALEDGQAGSLLACRCTSCGASFVLVTAPAAAALSCRTGRHTLAVDAPVARPVHPEVESALPGCDACGGDFSDSHPLRCSACSMPFVDLARHPEDLPYETYAAAHRDSVLQWFRPAEHGWRAANDGNWYPPSLF
jgi:hypothetical protein